MAKIKIIENGRSGTIRYIEGWFKKNVCEFYWEFGGGDTIATVWFPAEDKWDAKYPWAAGRRKKIMDDVAASVRRKKAMFSRIEWADDSFSLVRS